MKTQMRRIYIIGNSAAGKSSLAKKLSSILRIKNYDLDDIYWKKKFSIKRDKAVAEKMVRKITAKPKWIIEGVYSSCITCSLDKADLIVWLDYPANVIVWRLLKRQIKRKEKLSSMIDFLHYALDYYRKPTHKHCERNESTYYKHKAIAETYPAEIVRIKNKKQLEEFIRKVSNKTQNR